jgi:hypothetical protein
MAILYVSTDGTKWGSGLGRRLTVSEHDNNNWQISERLTALEGATGGGITGFGITGPTGAPGSQMLVYMDDGSTFGPYALPVATFNSRGAYLAGATYLVNDVFYINAALYLVIWPHIAPDPFNAVANDGAGHFYYSKLIDMPTAALPTGGATGYNLRKLSSNDFDCDWAAPLPGGGETGWLMVKNSSNNFDAGWIEPPVPLPPSGGTGYLLSKASELSYDYAWIEPPNALPPSGATGYVLIKNSSNSYDVAWATAPVSLPTGGSTGHVLKKNSSNNFDASWGAAAAAPSVVTGTTGIGTYSFQPVDRAKYRFTPTGNLTIAPFGAFIGNYELIITSTGATAFTVTLGGAISDNGTVDTGTTPGQVTVVSIVGDNEGHWEAGRVGPYAV